MLGGCWGGASREALMVSLWALHGMPQWVFMKVNMLLLLLLLPLCLPVSELTKGTAAPAPVCACVSTR
eukprot:1156408-Pelagomonas_calceolata.AAC.6